MTLNDLFNYNDDNDDNDDNENIIQIDNTSSKAIDKFMQYLMTINDLKGLQETSQYLKTHGIDMRTIVDDTEKKYNLHNIKQLIEFKNVIKNGFVNQYIDLAKKLNYLYIYELTKNLPDFFETYIYPVIMTYIDSCDKGWNDTNYLPSYPEEKYAWN